MCPRPSIRWRARSARLSALARARRSDLRAGKAGFRNLDRPNVERGTIDITAPATPDAARWNGWGTRVKARVRTYDYPGAQATGSAPSQPTSWRTVSARDQHRCLPGLKRTGQRTRPPVGGRALRPTAANLAGRRAKRQARMMAAAAASPTWCTTASMRFWRRFLMHLGNSAKDRPGEVGQKDSVNCCGDYGPIKAAHPRGDAGSAARFFYSAKATAQDRMDSKHPTVKPLALMNWLVKLITPPGGTVLDPFAGTGSTLLAADRLGFSAIGIEQSAEYVADIHRRFEMDAPLFAQVSS